MTLNNVTNITIKNIHNLYFNYFIERPMDTYNMKIENEEDDDMGLQLALKKARKLKQLEKIICIQPRNISFVVVKFGTYR